MKNGLKFATLEGKVSKVGHNFVQVAASDEFDNLTFWVREGQFGISPTLTDHSMTIIKPEAMASN